MHNTRCQDISFHFSSSLLYWLSVVKKMGGGGYHIKAWCNKDILTF